MPVDPEIQKLLDKHKDRLTGGGGGGDGGGSWNPFSTEEATTGAGAVGKGIIQGGLGYLEAPAQAAEWGLRKVTGNENLKLPGHDWASAYKRSVESSTGGQVGEAIGSALPMFLPAGWIGAAGRGASLAARGLRGAEELPSFLGAAGKGAEAVAASDRLLPSMAKGAAGAALSQPVSGDNFAQEKLQQMIAGSALGGMAGKLMRGRYSSAEELAAREAGFTSRGAQKAAQRQGREDFHRRLEEAASSPYPPAWAKQRAKQKAEEPMSRKLWDIAAHLGPHALIHHLLPGVGMFARWHAARALGELARQARLPNASPELRAAVDRIYRNIQYNPDVVPYVAGAQANRYYPEEEENQ